LLLERALAFYQDLLDARPENPGLRQELARAYHRVGQINAMLGRPENAREAYERAITMFEQLTAKVPNDPEHRHLLAISYDFLGELLRQGGTDLQAAEQHYRDALRIQDDLVRDNSARRDFRRERTRSHNNLGILLMDTGRNEEAEHSFTSAIEGLEQLVAENPSLGAFQADLARAYINRGVLARKQKRVSHAEQAYAKAVGILGELVAAHPEEREYRYKWAVSYLDLGNLLLEETPRFDDALANCETANQLLRALEAAFPAIPLYCRELANSYISLANVHARAGDLDAARDAFEQALKHLDELAVNFADLAKGDAAYHSLHGITLGGLGYVALTRRAADEARDFVERAAQAQSAAVQLQPDNPEYRRRLELHYSFLAQILKKLGREDEARQAQRKAEGLKPGS
jgi:tetratricopeptide (TPR) repeat protein